MPSILEKHCPKCGESLIVRFAKRDGHAFIGCLGYPSCKYTEEVPMDWEEVLDFVQPTVKKVAPCPKCKGTGKLPLIKNERVIPYAYVYCDCGQGYNPTANTYRKTVRPEDYDYPMAWSQWRGICRQNGWPDPGSDEPDERIIPVDKPTLPTPPELRSLIARLDNQQGQLNYLQNKVMEKRVEKKNGNSAF